MLSLKFRVNMGCLSVLSRRKKKSKQSAFLGNPSVIKFSSMQEAEPAVTCQRELPSVFDSVHDSLQDLKHKGSQISVTTCTTDLSVPGSVSCEDEVDSETQDRLVLVKKLLTEIIHPYFLSRKQSIPEHDLSSELTFAVDLLKNWISLETRIPLNFYFKQCLRFWREVAFASELTLFISSNAELDITDPFNHMTQREANSLKSFERLINMFDEWIARMMLTRFSYLLYFEQREPSTFESIQVPDHSTYHVIAEFYVYQVLDPFFALVTDPRDQLYRNVIAQVIHYWACSLTRIPFFFVLLQCIRFLPVCSSWDPIHFYNTIEQNFHTFNGNALGYLSFRELTFLQSFDSLIVNTERWLLATQQTFPTIVV